MSSVVESFARIVDDRNWLDMDSLSIVRDLIDMGVLHEDVIRRAVVRKEFYDRIGENERTDKSIQTEIAAKYHVSLSYVRKCIYYYTDVRV